MTTAAVVGLFCENHGPSTLLISERVEDPAKFRLGLRQDVCRTCRADLAGPEGALWSAPESTSPARVVTHQRPSSAQTGVLHRLCLRALSTDSAGPEGEPFVVAEQQLGSVIALPFVLRGGRQCMVAYVSDDEHDTMLKYPDIAPVLTSIARELEESASTCETPQSEQSEWIPLDANTARTSGSLAEVTQRPQLCEDLHNRFTRLLSR